MEEVSFRGWLMTSFAEVGRFDRRWWTASLLATSPLFGAVHVYQGLSGINPTGFTGFVFGALYLATGRNLWACIVAHGTLDTIGFTMLATPGPCAPPTLRRPIRYLLPGMTLANGMRPNHRGMVLVSCVPPFT
jgi:membrane protease YdiL (CAAX protease family)